MYDSRGSKVPRLLKGFDMGVMLYRPGTSHFIRGYQCEMAVFNTDELQVRLSSGWKTSPEEANAIPEEIHAGREKEDEGKELEEETSEIKTEETETLSLHGLSNKEIREVAKTYGIEQWDKLRIGTLKEMMGDA